MATEQSVLERPLQELFPLEVGATNTECLDQDGQDEEVHEEEQAVPARPVRTRRTVAIVADERIKLIDHLFKPIENTQRTTEHCPLPTS